MKKILYILVLSFAFFGCEKSEKKTYANCTKDELTISPDLVPYFNAFVDDCELQGLKYDHAYCLNWIRMGHLRGIQGETCFDNGGTIEINEHLTEDSIGMKFVVYHEIGHWFGLDHSTGIMKENYNADDTEYVRENWNELLNDYFAKLKNQ